ncbi:MAG: biopolymer transporter ExbD [Spirochaetaceae bacterium]|nr:biopolymer transporter ExbD [Spirochaetaceae bacterium]
MNLTRKKRKGFDDSSASSDIAFLLIIYFIVIAGFNINKGFLMNLPAKDSTRRILMEDLLRFELDDTGRILYQGEALPAAAVEGAIRSAVNANPNIAVLLTISPGAPWQQVVSFVELAQKLSVDSFSFRIKDEPPGDAGGEAAP